MADILTNPFLKRIHLSSADHERLIRLRERQPMRSIKPLAPSQGEKFADLVTDTVGSWRFILIQSCLLFIWIVLNVVAWIKVWDPYPFILLNLALSFQAAYATPFILMSQNRQSSIDREKAQQDFECNLKAEMEIELLHQKIDHLQENEMTQLKQLLLQQQQIILRLERRLQQPLEAGQGDPVSPH